MHCSASVREPVPGSVFYPVKCTQVYTQLLVGRAVNAEWVKHRDWASLHPQSGGGGEVWDRACTSVRKKSSANEKGEQRAVKGRREEHRQRRGAEPGPCGAAPKPRGAYQGRGRAALGWAASPSRHAARRPSPVGRHVVGVKGRGRGRRRAAWGGPRSSYILPLRP